MDKIIEKDPQSLFESYLDFLSSLFKNSTVKPAISLAYLTGILPIVRDLRKKKFSHFVKNMTWILKE